MKAIIKNCNNNVTVESEGNVKRTQFLKRVKLELENFRSTTNITIFIDGVEYSVQDFEKLINHQS